MALFSKEPEKKSQDSTDHYRADARRQHAPLASPPTSSSSSSAPSPALRAARPLPQMAAHASIADEDHRKVTFEGPARIAAKSTARSTLKII